jgi:pilus assembly protein FimV
MSRPPKKTIVAALGGIFLALSTSLSYAAGLGKLSVNSALGQPLSAEIELVSLLPGEFEVLTARTASPEAYTEARIEYSPLLRQLRFAVERKANGTPILKITSNAPINEPFLDVLVEMTWPSGRLVREYPILLDPPGFNEARIQAPVAAVSPKPATVVPTAPTAPVVAAPSAAAARAEASPPANKGDTYGPVKRGDTLAKIATEMKGDGISLDQMLVALFRENKQAFANNNMNQLKTGQILRIPSAADVAKLSKAEANKEVRVQVADWKAYREQIAGAAASAPAKPAPSNVATGQVATATPVTPPAPPVSDQLKIAKADSTAKPGAAGAKDAPAAAAANAAKEDAIAKQKALEEAKTRIALLEKQQADAKKLVELKAAAPAPTPVPATVPPTQVAQVAPTPVPATTPPAATPSAPAPVAAAPDAAKPAEAPKVEAVKPVPPKAPVKVTPPPPKEPELMDVVMDNAPYVAGGVGLVGLVGLLFMRRRKQNAAGGVGATTQTSSLMPSDLKPNTITGNKAGGLVDTGNSSFLTDFDKTGPGAIDTDEVDPVAEAEVYIAYGRDAQAEEILKEAMTRDKGRHEISMKLLEIYHARKSAPAFETVARQLKDAVGESDPVWFKAAAMGASIDPTNSLYGGSTFDSTGKFAAGGTVVLAGAGAAGLAAASASSAAEAGKPDLDFDLGFDDAPAAKATDDTFDITAPNTDQPAPAAGDSLDFDLDIGADPTPAKSTTSGAASLDVGGGLDFDLGLDDSPAPTSAAANSAPSAAASGFDFDLSSLSLDEPEVSVDKTQKVVPVTPVAAMPSMNLSDLSLDLDTPSDGDAASGADLGAVATKLELAKAYIEIGDSDGAKEILNEVAREGSAAQAAEAKTILASL